MVSLTEAEIRGISFVGKLVELHLKNRETICGIIQSLSTDHIVVQERTGLSVLVLLTDIETATFDVGRKDANTDRSGANKFRNRCNAMADNAGLVLARLFGNEFSKYEARCGNDFFRAYLRAELKRTAESYAGATEQFRVMFEQDMCADGRRFDPSHAVYATVLFRLRQYDKAVAALMQKLEEDQQTVSLKLACLYSQMKNQPGVLFWLDLYFHAAPDPKMFSDNAWWQYLRLCSKYGYYETLGDILNAAAEHSPKTVTESLAYLFLINSSRAFGIQLLDISKNEPSTSDARDALETYLCFLQPDLDSNYHRYRLRLLEILTEIGHQTYEETQPVSGFVYEYIPDRGYGFIVGFDLISYFFHHDPNAHKSIMSDNVYAQIKGSICSFATVAEEHPVMVTFDRIKESKSTYNAVNIV